MYQKRGKAYDQDRIPHAKRFKTNVGDLYLGNEISAERAQSLFQDAEASGATGLSALAKVGARGTLRKNVARDLRRQLAKGSKWPRPYLAAVRVVDPKRGEQETQEISILLPHELVWTMAEETHYADKRARERERERERER